MYHVNMPYPIALGYQTENKSRVVQIDVSPWMKQWPDATVIAEVLRPGENDYYLVDLAVTDGVASWTITSADVAISGKGMLQIVALQAETRLCSAVFGTYIAASIPGSASDTPPDPAKPWVDKLVATETAYRAELSQLKQMVAEMENASGGGNPGLQVVDGLLCCIFEEG